MVTVCIKKMSFIYLFILKFLNSGVRAGMFVRDAKALCPQLIIFPYNFEAYEEVDPH